MSTRAQLIAYWSTTGLLAFGMTAGGTGQILRASFNVEGIIHLGYPLYVLTILGVWKLCGVGVLLAPRRPLLKEWAYAGFFFLLTGAVASHIASGDGFGEWIAAFVFACLTVSSWWLRPADRRLALPHGRWLRPTRRPTRGAKRVKPASPIDGGGLRPTPHDRAQGNDSKGPPSRRLSTT